MTVPKASTADVVIFIASQFYKLDPIFPSSRLNSSVFVFHTMEQPKYIPLLNDHNFLKQFNMLATYFMTPKYFQTGILNLPLSYYPLHVYPVEAVLNKPLPFSEKTGFGTGSN